MTGLLGALELGTLGRLALAVVLGGAVGLERELSGKPAGLRTNILICVGAALFTEMSIALASTYVPHDLIRSDPARIAAQIVSGVGFLGAGTILVARGNVVGLTTAATIWVVAAIGVAIGVEAYVIAVGTAALVVLTLFLLGRLERRVLSAREEASLELRCTPEAGPDLVREVLDRTEFRGRLITWESNDEASRLVFVIRGREESREELMRMLSDRPEVREISFSWGPAGAAGS